MPKRWMSDAKLRQLWNDGVSYDEVAQINGRVEGWEPSRSGVFRKYERMGMPPRRQHHKDLIPWTIRPEHSDDRFRHMLQAEGRKRSGGELSGTDRKLVSMLHDLLYGRGKLMVVGYHPEVGFYTTERLDTDEDIIRAPKKPREAHPDIDTAISTLKDEELAEFAASLKLRPEVLENAGRDRAADLLRKVGQPDADLDLLPEHDDDVASPRRRRRRAG